MTSTNLNTYQVNSCTNKNPKTLSQLLSKAYNSNIHTYSALSAKSNTNYPLTDESYLKILSPGSHFVIGAIANGTLNVKQMCDNQKYSPSGNCNLTLWSRTFTILPIILSLSSYSIWTINRAISFIILGCLRLGRSENWRNFIHVMLDTAWQKWCAQPIAN